MYKAISFLSKEGEQIPYVTEQFEAYFENHNVEILNTHMNFTKDEHNNAITELVVIYKEYE